MRWVCRLKENRMNRDEGGYILIMSLFVLVVISLVGISLVIVGINEYNISARTQLMDRAYAIAEAGVNRAAVQIRIDDTIADTVGTLYRNNPPQWGYHTESFGGGEFTVAIWQNEQVPYATNPCYKVIEATGTITEGERTAERTILTRVIVGGGGEEYDASFDYLIYNGMSDSRLSPPADNSIWPDSNFIIGHFTFDGDTPYPDPAPPGVTPAYPKGACYTRGTIDLAAYFMADLQIKGNLVATDDIKLANAGEVTLFNEALTIDNGHVIAGIDGTGDASIDIKVVGGLGQEPVQLSGYLCAADDVTISSLATLSFGGDAVETAGIIAGGEVNVEGILGVQINGGLNLGNIFSGSSTTVESYFGSGTTFTNINAGRSASGLGVHFETFCLGPIGRVGAPAGPVYTEGKIDIDTLITGPLIGHIYVGELHAGTDTGIAPNYYGGTGIDIDCTFGDVQVSGNGMFSRGKVDMDIINAIFVQSTYITAGTDSSAAAGGGMGVDIDAGSLAYTSFANGITSTGKVEVDGGGIACTLGSIVAGTDDNSGHGGTGIDVDMGGVGFSVGNLTAQGTIDLSTGGIGGGIGTMWSGNDVDCSFTGMGAGIGDISAYDDIDMTINVTVGGAGVGRCSANGDVILDTNGVGATYVDGCKSGQRTRLSFDGLGWLVCQDLNPWNRGPGTPTNTWPGYNPDDDAICAGGAGECRLRPTAGWLTLEGDTYHFPWGDLGDCESAGTINASGIVYYDDLHQGVGGLVNWTPGVDEPGVPARPAMPNYVGGIPSGTGAWLHGTPPTINQDLLLYLAGLQEPVVMLQPNWSYFEGAATQDDISNPSVPHMIYDTGLPADGDYDGVAGNGEILFKWDNTLAYSSNETIYNGDSAKDIILNLNWAGEGADFTGTIVSQGDVLIDDTQVDWFVGQDHILNVVAGNDIKKHIGGLALWESSDSHYHFWADHNIDLRDLQFSLGANLTFYGSFTAGNRVMYNNLTFWENSEFKWSRWALDPVAWVPPFEVLSWKEI